MYQTYRIAFALLVFVFLATSCKKDKGISTDPKFPSQSTPTNTTAPTTTLTAPSGTIYTIIGKVRSFKCSNVNSGNVYLNYPSLYPGPTYTAPMAPIQPDGSFTFTYSSTSSYSTITISFISPGHQGIYNKQTKTIPANQNSDIGTYDFDPRCGFYVRFRSLTNSPTSSVSLIDETYATHQNNYPYHTPVLQGPFTDTTLWFLHDAHGGNVAQHDMIGYDPYSESTVTELPISFNCQHNNIIYSSQKNITKCSYYIDTLYINLP